MQDPEHALQKFLPEVHRIVDSQGEAPLKDKHGSALPPCIVMERGEPLDAWAARSGALDIVTVLQVLLLWKMPGTAKICRISQQSCLRLLVWAPEQHHQVLQPGDLGTVNSCRPKSQAHVH